MYNVPIFDFEVDFIWYLVLLQWLAFVFDRHLHFPAVELDSVV